MRKPKDKALIEAVPLMKCGNKIEYMQRLNWLSEGMLRNHLEHVYNYKNDQMILHVVLKSKEELSTLRTTLPNLVFNQSYGDSFMFIKLHFINVKKESKCCMAYKVADAPKSPMLSIEELQHWLLLVSMSWSPEEALTQITGGT